MSDEESENHGTQKGTVLVIVRGGVEGRSCRSLSRSIGVLTFQRRRIVWVIFKHRSHSGHGRFVDGRFVETFQTHLDNIFRAFIDEGSGIEIVRS